MSRTKKKKVYVMFSEYGELLGYFTSAKKAYNALIDDDYVWYGECNYSYFQRTISKPNNNKYWKMRHKDSTYIYGRRFEPCFEV